jgi:hypothetical protein
MCNQLDRTLAWVAELANIQAEIAAKGIPAPATRTVRTRRRELKPLWEE